MFKGPNSGLTYFDHHGGLNVYKTHDRDPILWNDGMQLVFRCSEDTTGCGDTEHCPNQFCDPGVDDFGYEYDVEEHRANLARRQEELDAQLRQTPVYVAEGATSVIFFISVLSFSATTFRQSRHICLSLYAGTQSITLQTKVKRASTIARRKSCTAIHRWTWAWMTALECFNTLRTSSPMCRPAWKVGSGTSGGPLTNPTTSVIRVIQTSTGQCLLFYCDNNSQAHIKRVCCFRRADVLDSAMHQQLCRATTRSRLPSAFATARHPPQRQRLPLPLA